jgi:pimeloyl-ACP methyl ester carboxylesterase
LVRKVREVILKIPPRILAARLNSMLRLEGADRTNCRVIYLRGIHDRVVPERVVLETLARCPNHTRVNIEAAHLLLQTAPENAWEAISAFAGSPG